MIVSTATAAPLQDRYFESDGVKIRYIDQGEGEPLILIHGLARDIEFNWVRTGLLEALASQYRVIAFDCRGHGRSDKPHSEGPYGRHMVDDLGRLMAHLGIDRAHIVGHSLGGRIAFKFAAMYPQQIRSLVLIGTGGTRTTDDPTLWEMLAESLRRGDGIAPLAWKMWPPDRPIPTEDELNTMNDQFLAGNDVPALACVAAQFAEFGATPEEIRQIQAPILAVIGDQDVFRSEVDALKADKPEMEVVLIENATFSTILELPELRESITDFLKRGADPAPTSPPSSELPPP